MDDGRLNDALADIRHSYKVDPDSFTRDLLIESLTTALAKDFTGNRDAVGELENLVQLDRQRAAYLRVLASGLQKTGDRLGAMDAYLKLAALDSPEETEDVDSTLSVARDRWVRARFDALLAEASVAERKKIDASIEKQLNTALAAKDPDALEKFLSTFGDHPAADRAREALVAQSADSQPPLVREQLLRSLEQSTDPARRKAAMAKMADLLRSRRPRRRRPARIIASCKRSSPISPCSTERTSKQLLAGLPADSPLRSAESVGGGLALGRSDRREKRRQAAADARVPRQLEFGDARIARTLLPRHDAGFRSAADGTRRAATGWDKNASGSR